MAAAEELAASGPMGSHHLLEALARSEDSLAAKVLAALGVDADVLAAKIDELGVAGTTDVTPEEAAAQQMEVRLEGGEVHVVLRDEASVALARIVTEHLGGPVRGDDPVAGSLAGLWPEVVRALESVGRQLEPPADEQGGDRGSRSAVVRRAIQSRLRRRRSGEG